MNASSVMKTASVSNHPPVSPQLRRSEVRGLARRMRLVDHYLHRPERDALTYEAHAWFVVNVLDTDQSSLALLMASKGIQERFELEPKDALDIASTVVSLFTNVLGREK